MPPSTPRSPKFSRRGLLAAGGGATVLAGLGASFGLGAPSASADTAVPPSGKFDLTAPSNRLFWKKPLHNATVLQCFSFDNSKGHLYTLQVTQGSSPAQGNLTMTQLDLTGKKLGRMYLKGFGHGISFGVQPTSSGPVMWTEAVIGPGDRATKVCRFKFRNTATPITQDDVELFTPIEGMRSASCSLDLDHNTIAVRYIKDGLDSMHVSLYDFTKFAAGDFSAPLTDISLGQVHPPGITPQGYQHYGQHLYLFQGNAYYYDEGTAEEHCDVTHPDGELDGNAKVSRINFNDPSDHETHLTKAGFSLNFREPEGLGLLKLNGKPRLCMGFASGCAGSRLANVYYKDSDPT